MPVPVSEEIVDRGGCVCWLATKGCSTRRTRLIIFLVVLVLNHVVVHHVLCHQPPPPTSPYYTTVESTFRSENMSEPQFSGTLSICALPFTRAKRSDQSEKVLQQQGELSLRLLHYHYFSAANYSPNVGLIERGQEVEGKDRKTKSSNNNYMATEKVKLQLPISWGSL